MTNTAIELNDIQKQKLVQGYWMKNQIYSPNQLNTLWASGSGLKSSLSDLMYYIKLQLDKNNPVVSRSHTVLYKKGKVFKIGHFWRIWHDKYGTSYNHHGGTSGTQNWIFIFSRHHMGISIISNHSGPKTPNKLYKTVRKILKDIIDE